jgi:hypothetical protein
MTPPDDAITITFPQPAPLLNLNDRDNRYARARKVKAWRTTARDYAATRHHPGDEPFPPSYFAITIDVPTNRHRDSSNWQATQKPVLDGCVDAGLWPGDDSRWITECTPRLRVSRDRTITIHIWPREQQQ